jgi:lipopolysaccharide transport system permease protein
MLPEKFGALRYLYGINPLAGIIEGFRWCLLHHVPETTIHPPWILISIGSMVSLTMLFSGLYYFKRMENQFADII